MIQRNSERLIRRLILPALIFTFVFVFFLQKVSLHLTCGFDVIFPPLPLFRGCLWKFSIVYEVKTENLVKQQNSTL